MSTIHRLFEPLRTAAQAFFKHDLSLRRDDGAVRLVLEERPEPGKPRPPTRAEAARVKEKAELALMREQLATVLDEMPDTRQALRHLAFVEQALRKNGLKALRKVPLEVLQRALEQLEGLVTNWSPEGLANLRSKMAVTSMDREHGDPDAEADAYRTAAVFDAVPSRAVVPDSAARSDDDALAAAYAALGTSAPDTASGVEIQTELGSTSGRALRPHLRGAEPLQQIQLRELQG